MCFSFVFVVLFFPVFRVLVSLRFSRGSQKWARAELVWHYGAAWLGPLMNTREACVSVKCRPLQSGIQATGSSQRDEWLWNHTGWGGKKRCISQVESVEGWVRNRSATRRYCPLLEAAFPSRRWPTSADGCEFTMCLMASLPRRLYTSSNADLGQRAI